MADSDIDDELLALAGDASEDEEESEAPKNISRNNSASPNRRTSGKAGANKLGGRKNKRRDDSEEEGEASSGASSPDSQRSAPMDESDSDSDTSPMDDDGEGYPLEGKFKDAADKAEIMAMPEIKREELLAERAGEVEKSKQNRVLRQLLKSREAEAKKVDKKRKASAANLDGDNRKTARQRTKIGGGKVGEASSGIDRYRRERAEKSERQRRREEDKHHDEPRRNTRGDYSDHDSDRDSEVEWDTGKTATKKRSISPDFKNAEPAGLQDVERVRVGRSRFALVCFYPGFDEAITGCFARISVGMDKETRQNIYRVGLIKGFVEDKPYAAESANGKPFLTTQYVRAAHGKSERNWPFIACSDSPFTEAEWTRYTKTCQAEGIPLPTKPKLAQKILDINALVNRSWTEEELQAKLKRSGVLVSKFNPIERKRLQTEIAEAKLAKNYEREEQLQKELDALDGPKLAYSTSLQPSPAKTPAKQTQQERLAVLNKQHRRENAEKVRQAQIAERKKIKMAEAAAARGEVVVEDHSRRVRTNAKFKHDVADTHKKTDSAGASGANTPSQGTPKLGPKQISGGLPLQWKNGQGENKQKNGLPSIRRPLMDDDIIGAIDLGIDLEL
ncbi:hypothetical protein HYALB_00006267 [Hymenoscyphus albidus]|uniref:Plus3 domain-containing protein n=1 Tax=Hymenoscyphus albidus TaxID=595503 RepID=A0A9N9Q2T1_9HELO|nr:hypothetical protein HYALB_00006267 [Hymenoscyphus albidus]